MALKDSYENKNKAHYLQVFWISLLSTNDLANAKIKDNIS